MFVASFLVTEKNNIFLFLIGTEVRSEDKSHGYSLWTQRAGSSFQRSVLCCPSCPAVHPCSRPCFSDLEKVLELSSQAWLPSVRPRRKILPLTMWTPQTKECLTVLFPPTPWVSGNRRPRRLFLQRRNILNAKLACPSWCFFQSNPIFLRVKRNSPKFLYFWRLRACSPYPYFYFLFLLAFPSILVARVGVTMIGLILCLQDAILKLAPGHIQVCFSL